MKSSRIILIMLAALCVASCGRKVTVKGTVKDAPQSPVVVAQLDVNTYNVLDTVKTGKDGGFTYRIPVEKGQPEFVYFLYNGKKIASLLLVDDKNVSFQADTTGHYEVDGSEESNQLREVEYSFADFMSKMRTLSSKENPSNGEITRLYIEYYRDRVKYIMEHPNSMTVIPVLYQKINEFSPIFAQTTDALHFRAAADSLGKLYPESKYVKALIKETERREQYLALDQKLAVAREEGFPDLNLPDINGKMTRLSEVDSKVILVYFWDPANAAQKMFNQDTVSKLYSDYHSKGFEIYSVAITTDKMAWGKIVNSQGFKWINVCDGLGPNSPVIQKYNLASTPAALLIANGDIVTSSVGGEAGLRKELQRLLN